MSKLGDYICYILVPKYHWLIYEKLYIRFWYKYATGKKLNLNTPVTFSEKLQWLKIYDRNPLYTTLVDKIASKEYVGKMIGFNHIIPTIATYDKVDDINWELLPKSFVLKCSHDSGGMVLCKNKSTLDIHSAKRKLNNCLKNNYSYSSCEWAYRDVRPRILCEQYMEDGRYGGLTDYKFYCFNGVPRYLYVSAGLEDHKTAKISFLTMDWKFAPFRRSDFYPFSELPQKPDTFEDMVKIARQLSKDIPFVRVDLYEINGSVFFSELTLYPCAGVMPIEPKEWDKNLGDLLKL